MNMMECMAVFLVLVAVSVTSLPVNDGWDTLIRRRRDANDCQLPANIEELLRRLNENTDTSIYLRFAGGDTQRPFLEDELNMNQVQESRVYGTRTCPATVSDDPEDPLWMRSLCPWYYNVTELPPGNYPRTIPQAVCKCSNCIENNLNQCERVATHIRVLEKTDCKDGFFTYKPKTITHYVGCICAKRRTKTVSPDESSSTSGGSNPSSQCGPIPCAT